MKTFPKFYVFLLLLFSVKGSIACSCIGPDNFMDSIDKLVLQVEVIDVQALDTGRYAYTATRVKVLSRLKGEYKSDTLLVLNDKGFECFHGLRDHSPGKQYMITGDVLDQWTSWEYWLDSTYHGRMMVLYLCAENIISIEHGKLKGNITKNKVKKVTLLHKLNHVIRNEEGYYNWLSKHESRKRKRGAGQSMSIAALERRIDKQIITQEA